MKLKIFRRACLRLSLIVLSFLFVLPLPLKVGGETTRSGSSINSSLFARAAEQNSRLMNELSWSFGGKSQRGWALYSSLISRMIGARTEPETEEFALALASWQKKIGLPGHGVMDQETWMKMVSHFQGNRRLGRSRSQAEQQLETVPSSSFFDPQRPEELRRVEKEALAAYRRMMAAAAIELSSTAQPSEKWLKIISAYRSPAYQAELRRRSPNAGRAGLAVNSPHFTGRALDLYVGGEPVSTRDHNRAIQVKTAAYQWLVKNAGRFGFTPYFYEPWHWEYSSSVD